MEELRPLLITYAYTSILTYEDAKAIVRDALLKFTNTNRVIRVSRGQESSATNYTN